MGRKILAVLVGYALWTLLYFGGNLILAASPSEDPGFEQDLRNPEVLIPALLMSMAYSFIAGMVTAKIARSPGKPVLVMGAMLLGSGILAQASYWSVMPLWFHVSFLVALLPVCLIGARVVTINKPE